MEPLTPSDCDLRDFAFMPLDVSRLRDSDLSAEASGDEFRAAVLLWCASWHQIPAASLPNDEKIIAHLCGFGRAPKEWKRIREGALRGFVLCSDGRLYHPHVAEKANEAWQSRGKFAEKREKDRERLREWRDRKRVGNVDEIDKRNDDETRFRNDDETRTKPLRQGTGDRGQGRTTDDTSVGGAAKRGLRLPVDFVMPVEWLQWAMTERHWAAAEAQDEAASFADFWHAKAGKDAAKLDWQATWRNWVRNSRRVGVVQRSESAYPPGHSGVPL